MLTQGNINGEQIFMRQSFYIGVILAAAYWLYGGIAIHGVWARARLGSGFMPALTGLMALTCSIYMLIMNKNAIAEKKGAFDIKALLPIASLALTIGLSYIIGLILSLLLFIFLWFRLYEKIPCRKSAIVSIITCGIIYAIFIHWLMLPFPKGILNAI